MNNISYILTEVSITKLQFISKKIISKKKPKYNLLFFRSNKKSQWQIIPANVFSDELSINEQVIKTYTEEEFVQEFFHLLLKKANP